MNDKKGKKNTTNPRWVLKAPDNRGPLQELSNSELEAVVGGEVRGYIHGQYYMVTKEDESCSLWAPAAKERHCAKGTCGSCCNWSPPYFSDDDIRSSCYIGVTGICLIAKK